MLNQFCSVCRLSLVTSIFPKPYLYGDFHYYYSPHLHQLRFLQLCSRYSTNCHALTDPRKRGRGQTKTETRINVPNSLYVFCLQSPSHSQVNQTCKVGIITLAFLPKSSGLSKHSSYTQAVSGVSGHQPQTNQRVPGRHFPSRTQ